MKRPLRVAAVGLLALLLAVGAGLSWVATTAAGTRWSLGLLGRLLPDLELDVEGGTWADGLRVRLLRYEAPVVTVTITGLQLRVRPWALARWQLAVPEASAESVVLQLVDDGSPPSPGLPTVSLPIALTARHLAVPHFELITVGGTRLVAAIETGLTWRGTAIHAVAGALQWGQLHIDTNLGIWLQGDYAVDAQATLDAPALGGPLTAELEGSLRALQAQGRWQGRLPLAFAIKARLLDDGLPLTATASSAAPAMMAFAGEQLTIDDIAIEVTGRLDDLEGTLHAALHNPRYGTTTLDAPLVWRQGRLSVDEARWQSDYGAIAASCDAEPGAGRWRCAGDLQQLSPAPWTQALAGQVSSPFVVSGTWGEAGNSLRATLESLRGRLAGQPLSGRAALSSSDLRNWHIDAAKVAFGATRAALSGSIGEEIDIAGTVELANLAQLHEGARGSLSAAVAVSGPLAQPSLTSTVTGRGLAYGQYRARELRGDLLAAELGERPSRLALRLKGLRVGDTRLGRLQLTVEGDAARQQLRAALVGSSEYRAELSCSGVRGARWGVDCNRFDGLWRIGDAVRGWELADALQVELPARGGSVRVEPFCIVASPASLCLTTPLVLTDDLAAPARVTLARLPLSWWAGLLPANTRLTGQNYLGADLELTGVSPLAAHLAARMDGIDWTWSNDDGTYPASLQAVDLLVDFGPDRARLTASANSAALGLGRLELEVADPAGQRRLKGRLELRDLQLEAFRWVAESIQQLQGVVGGEVFISGTAAHPHLNGSLELADGVLRDVSLPFPLENIAARVEFNELAADITGSLQANGGRARVNGRLQLPRESVPWQLRAAVDTDVIGFVVLEDSTVAGSGKFTILASPGRIRVSGDLRVVEADIRLRTLPPNTIGTSADAEIVGLGEQRALWRVDTDITAALGKKLHFRGFGADLWLTGSVRFRNSERFYRHMTGEVRVERGRYRAYGQELNIRDGKLLFTGPIENPDLRFEAVRRSRDMETVGGLRVSGTLQNPVGELFSQPPMAESAVAYFVLTGRVRPESGVGTVSAEGTLLNLGLAQTNESAARFAERFGIKDFQISAAGTEAGVETRFSGFIAPNLLVSYGTGFQENTNTLTIQYFVTPKIIIEAISGFTSALDVIYSFSVE